MADLFDRENQWQPLAARMRPATLDQYAGQRHLFGEGMPLRKSIEAGHIHSMILWGPPGVGKTTLAMILANYVDAQFLSVSAVLSGVKEIRAAIDQAKEQQRFGRKTVLFVDVVHRFNKSQQDAFLPYIEDGTVIFIGATTENPSFELNNALLSRARVYVLKPLDESDVLELLQQAVSDPARGVGEDCPEMEGGVLQQYGSPAEIKERPANLFTGTFVGEPPMNVFPATASLSEGTLTFDLTGGLDLRYPESAFDPLVRKMVLDRRQVVIGVRPYAVHRAEQGAAARVVANQWLGDQSHIAASFAGKTIVLVEHDRAPLSEGEPIRVEIRPQDLHVFDPSSGLALSHGNELAA